MSDCCASPTSKNTPACPQCSEIGKHVSMRTLYHQIKFPDNQTIADGTYYFCPSQRCEMGYFSDTGKIILKQDLKSWLDIQRNKLCFCFDIDTDQYLFALNAGEAASIKNFVMQRTQSAECACDIRNPSGQCCLAKFKHLEQNHLTR